MTAICDARLIYGRGVYRYLQVFIGGAALNILIISNHTYHNMKYNMTL